MRFVIAAVAILTTPWADAFTPTCLRSPLHTRSRSTSSSLRASDFDISIEYDAAAKLAYEDWRKKYNKGSFDENKYPVFRANYEAVSIANVIALKKARDSGSVDTVKSIELNESADSALIQPGGISTEPKASLLKKALASSAAQSEAAVAIEEAAAALAEDEQLLAEQLGLESIEELEVAIDSIEGIAQDGGELDATNISREARIRSAYIEWCKEYNKTPDESRYPNFSSNFLALEEYARVNKKEITLNKYADCTEEEYISITSGSTTVPKKPDTNTAEKAMTSATAKAVFDVKAKEDSGNKVAKPAEEIKAEVKPKAASSSETPKPPAAKKVEEPKASKAAEPVDIEKLKKLREQELEKAAAAARAAAEAEAIATAKANAEKEAAQIAKRRQIEAEAAELTRAQAAKAKAELEARSAAKATLSNTKVTVPTEEPIAFDILSLLKPSEQKSSIAEQVGVDSSKPSVIPTKPVVQKKEEKSFTSVVEVKPTVAPIVASASSKSESLPVLKVPNVKSLSDSLPSAFKALIPPISSDIEPPKTVGKSLSKTAVDETSKQPVVTSAEFDITDPVTEAFSSFFGSKAPKKETPVIIPKAKASSAAAPPAVVAEEKESLSIFDFKSSDVAAPTVAKKPQPRSEPAPPKKESAFPFLNFKPQSDETLKAAPSNLKLPKVTDKPVTKALGDTLEKPVTPSPEFEISDPVSEAFASFFGSKASKTEPPVKIIDSKPKSEAIAKPKAGLPPLVKQKVPSAPVPTPAVAEKKESLSIFDFKSAADTAPRTATTKTEPISKAAPPKKESAFSLFNVKQASDDKSKVISAKTDLVVKLPVPPKKEPLLSVFGSKPVQTVTKVEPITPPVQKEKKQGNLFSVFSASNTISSSAKNEDVKKPSGNKPTDLIKKTATVSNVSPTFTESKKETSFTFFSKPKMIVKKPEPAPAPPAAIKKEPFKLFNPKSSSAGKLPVPPKTPTPASKKDSASAKVTSISSKTPIKAESKPLVGNFIRGLGSGTISLASDRVSNSSVSDDIPILKNWKRESDGSITGNVSNSKKFRNGSEITTSPVKGIIKSGSVVVTSSGSKYRLM